MKRRSMMKKSITAFILAVFLSVTLSAVEAAPGKKVYPYPAQQQNQQSSRPAAQKPRPSAPRPSMQHAKPVHQRQTIQRPKSVSPRQTMQQPKPVSQRQTVQRSKPVSQHQAMQRSRSGSPRPTMQRAKSVHQRQTIQQPRPVSQRQTMQQPKHTEVSREKLRPKTHNPRQNVAKPKIHDSKPNIGKPKVHDPKQRISKPKMHRPEYRKHRKPGPRKDLHRPPVHRTYKNMHISIRLGRDGYIQYFAMLLPVVVNEFLWSVGQSINTFVYGHIGTKELAGMSLTGSVQGLTIGAMSGLAQAAGILIGKRLGEREYKKAYEESKKLCIYGFIGTVFFSMMLVILRYQYVGIFLADLYSFYQRVQHISLKILCQQQITTSTNNKQRLLAKHRQGCTQFLDRGWLIERVTSLVNSKSIMVKQTLHIIINSSF